MEHQPISETLHMTSEWSGKSFCICRLGAERPHKACAVTGTEDLHWRKQKCVYGTVYFSYDSNSWMKGLIERKKVKFLLAPMGVLAPGSALLDPPLSPPWHQRKFLAHVSGRGGQQNLKTFLINFLAISGDSKHFFLLLFLNLKNQTPGARRGTKSYFFLTKQNWKCLK